MLSDILVPAFLHIGSPAIAPAELPVGAPTPREAGRLLCTAEHLTARADGGRNNSGNIAAACLHCNRARHRRKHPPGVDEFREEISRRMARRGWHPAWVHRLSSKGAAAPLPASRPD